MADNEVQYLVKKKLKQISAILELEFCVYKHVAASDTLKLPLLCVLFLSDSCNQEANNLMKKVVTTEHHMIQNGFFPFFLECKSPSSERFFFCSTTGSFL